MRHVIRFLALVWSLGLPASSPAATPIAHREVLPNGIVLLVAERPAVPIVAVRAYVRAGSAFDPPDGAGLANLTADLLTRGTEKRTALELDRAIEFVGGGLDADASRDGTSIALYVLKKDLALGLDLMTEVIRSPAFPADEVARKIKEITAAIKRSTENPEAVASRALMHLLYRNQPYGHPVEGTIESVGGLTRERAVEFYQRHFRPDAMIVAVVGAVTVSEARQAVRERFGGWARPDSPPPTVSTTPPPASDQSKTIERDLTQATVLLGRPAVRQDDPDYFPLVVANYVLGGGSASRLYVKVRDEAGLAYSVQSHVSPGRYGATAIISLQTRTSEAANALQIVRREMVRMATELVTEAELDLAKAYLIGSFPLRLDTSAKVATYVVAVEEGRLGLDYAETFTHRIARVSAEDVRRVSARYLAPGSFAAVTVGNVGSAVQSD